MSSRFLCSLFFAWIALFPLCSAMPRPQMPDPSPPTSPRPNFNVYKANYRTFTEPLQLLREFPTVSAPMVAPRGGDSNAVQAQNYMQNVREHDAYIHPAPDRAIDAVTMRMRDLISAEPHPPVADQVGFMGLFEELSRQSQMRIQGALHPKNVRAQHRGALQRHHARLQSMMRILDTEENTNKLMGQLDDARQGRVVKAMEILDAEHRLLGHAKEFGAKFPRLP